MLKGLNTDNKIILKNFSYLSILRFFNLGFKFFLVAYLIRVLGKINYGVLAWADSVIQYFLIFINFGFNVYAAKYIVDNKHNQTKVNEITSSIFTIKFILYVLSFSILFFFSFLDSFYVYKELLFLMLIMGIGEVFFPIWYFQGIEKIKPATYITVFSRFLLIVSTFLLVKDESDLKLHIILIVLSNITLGLLGLFALVKYYNFKFVIVSLTVIKNIIKEAYMFFLGRFLSLTFNFATIFIIGLYYTMDFVSGFDIALKIVLVCIIPFDMLQQALFPTIVRTEDKKTLKKLIFFSFIAGLALSMILYFFPEQLLSLFGGVEMTEYSNVLKTLSPIPPIVAITFMLGTCTLVAFGYNKEFNNSLIYSSLLYLFIVFVLFITDTITFWNLIYLRVVSDLVLMLIRVFYVYRNKILT